MLVEWSAQQFGVGVPAMDEQHRKLFDLANELYRHLINNSDNRHELEKAITSLVSYAQTHLSDEERLMKAAGYVDYENHKRNHDRILSQVSEMYEQFQRGETLIANQLLTFVANWLVEHIHKVDRGYSSCLQAQQPTL